MSLEKQSVHQIQGIFNNEEITKRIYITHAVNAVYDAKGAGRQYDNS